MKVWKELMKSAEKYVLAFLVWLYVKLSYVFPSWNEHDLRKAFWEKHRPNGGLRSLGTADQARDTLAECIRMRSARNDTVRWALESIRDQMKNFKDDDIVGDPNEVHHIIGKCLRVGYSIEGKPSFFGYTLETIESLNSVLCVVRFYGKIIFADYTPIMRTESCGGVSIM